MECLHERSITSCNLAVLGKLMVIFDYLSIDCTDD